jgi:hypothetical protein
MVHHSVITETNVLSVFNDRFAVRSKINFVEYCSEKKRIIGC